MRIEVLSLFPEVFASFVDSSIVGRAQEAELVDIQLTDIRDFSDGPHR